MIFRIIETNWFYMIKAKTNVTLLPNCSTFFELTIIETAVWTHTGSWWTIVTGGTICWMLLSWLGSLYCCWCWCCRNRFRSRLDCHWGWSGWWYCGWGESDCHWDWSRWFWYLRTGGLECPCHFLEYQESECLYVGWSSKLHWLGPASNDCNCRLECGLLDAPLRFPFWLGTSLCSVCMDIADWIWLVSFVRRRSSILLIEAIMLTSSPFVILRFDLVILENFNNSSLVLGSLSRTLSATSFLSPLDLVLSASWWVFPPHRPFVGF